MFIGKNINVFKSIVVWIINSIFDVYKSWAQNAFRDRLKAQESFYCSYNNELFQRNIETKENHEYGN